MFHGLDQDAFVPFIKAGIHKAVINFLVVRFWNLSLFNIMIGTGRFDEL